jgi:glutamate-5-semialdehyde dehydrogenase
MSDHRLTALTVGMPIPYAGDRVAYVPESLAANFADGDRLMVVQSSGALLHIPQAVSSRVSSAVGTAQQAFGDLAHVSDEAISHFFEQFADYLADDAIFAPIQAANDADVREAAERGRSTTRLALTPSMRADMIAGLRAWSAQPAGRDVLVATTQHAGWSVEERRAPLGVIGFVFEGRPNVFADATGVLRSGNTVVFRIGSDALGTARAIVTAALQPALQAAGLPTGAAVLLETVERSAGWALFADPRVALAVARGSGEAVEQLGGVARQSGVPVSLHGTGGSWMVVGNAASVDTFTSAVIHSLDRKVCNTLNVCCIPRAQAHRFVGPFLDALTETGARRGTTSKLHVAAGSHDVVPASWFTELISVDRAIGEVTEPRAEIIAVDDLGREWEWENNPEVALVLVDDIAHATELFNRLSPRFGVSLISDSDDEQQGFWQSIDAPFVGNGFTRWVDGQFALDKPELGLSNWQHGRLFARGGILSGDSAYTVRFRVRQTNPDLRR